MKSLCIQNLFNKFFGPFNFRIYSWKDINCVSDRKFLPALSRNSVSTLFGLSACFCIRELCWNADPIRAMLWVLPRPAVSPLPGPPHSAQCSSAEQSRSNNSIKIVSKSRTNIHKTMCHQTMYIHLKFN